MGSKRLYDFVDNNPIVEFHPSEYINDPFVIAQNDKMVAINRAIEVDLTGQVCSDSIGTRIYSRLRRPGRLHPRRGARRRAASRSSPAVDGARTDTITPDRADAHAGRGRGDQPRRRPLRRHRVRRRLLHGRTIRQRARALIDIAAPQFREELEAEAIELRYL